MNLDEYLKEHRIKRADFAKKIGCTYQYLTSIMSKTGKRKPGPKLIQAISKATRGHVSAYELLGKEHTDNQYKDENITHEHYTCTPSQDLVRTQRKQKVTPNLTHGEPLLIELTINGHKLFSKVLHENKQESEKCQNHEEYDIKLHAGICSQNVYNVSETHKKDTSPVLG